MNALTSPITFDRLVVELGGAGTTLPVYALVDAAQLHEVGLGRIPGIQTHELISLLGERAEPDALYVGPLLIPLSVQDSAMLVENLLSLLAQCNAISFLSSTTNLTNLTAHLRWLTEVRHDDGTEWVMRYFDPRILPFWLDVLSAEHKNLVMAPIHRWAYWAPNGMMRICEGENRQTFSWPSTMHLSDHQHERLMRAALPHIIGSMLEEDDPLIFSGKNFFQVTEELNFILHQGDQLGIKSLVDQKIFCFVSLRSVPNFFQLEAVAPAIDAAKCGKFHEHVMGWGDATWSQILKS